MLTQRWRTGRSVGRTIYLQVGEQPSKEDHLIGVLDNIGLAEYAVKCVNYCNERGVFDGYGEPGQDHPQLGDV